MEKTRYYSVTQLNNYIKGVFEDELILQNITVLGEVFECSESGGNIFITLKDDGGIINCVKFGKDILPAVGEKVLLTGSVGYYVKGGRISFRIKSIAPYGEGEFKRKLEALKVKLKNEGLFDNKLKLPLFVKSVAMVTSATGAVVHDFMSVIKKNHSYIDVKVYDARVQGEDAENSIVKAIACAQNSGCDVLIVARGGGSNDDLNCFNSEGVARAVFNSKIPVISSVGHEINYTLCDFCATMRSGTPSIAGETVCRINEEFIGKWYNLLSKMKQSVNMIYDGAKARALVCAKKLTDSATDSYFAKKLRLNSLIARAHKSIERKTIDKEKQFTATLTKLDRLTINLISEKEIQFKEKVAKLNALNPLAVLEIGYSKVFTKGKAISSAKQVSAGDELSVYMKDGVVHAHAESVKITEGD